MAADDSWRPLGPPTDQTVVAKHPATPAAAKQPAILSVRPAVLTEARSYWRRCGADTMRRNAFSPYPIAGSAIRCRPGNVPMRGRASA
jgi:hypothetical protein